MAFEIRYTNKLYKLYAVYTDTIQAPHLGAALELLRFNVPNATPVAYRIMNKNDDNWKKNSILF